MKFQDVDIYGNLNITGSFQVPYGAGTGSYPTNPSSGSLFFDTSDDLLYVYEGEWEVVGAQVTPPPPPYDIEYLVVAGGGAGGSYYYAGGGGAGGFLSSSLDSVDSGTELTIIVGAGGSPGANANTYPGGDGDNSSISGTNISISSIGGGGGAGRDGFNAADGGSGGGGGNNGDTGGSGTVGQGNDGGSCASDSGGTYGAGGGGAGQVGQISTYRYNNNADYSIGAPGGNGLQSVITGTSTYYAGGGGGGARDNYNPAGLDGGLGGGGTAGTINTQSPEDGTTNTGGGGGGAGGTEAGGAGGSGVVILRTLTSNYSGTTTGSPTVTTDGDYTVIKFTASGTYTA